LLQKEGREYSPHDGAHSRPIKLLLNLQRTVPVGSFPGLCPGPGPLRELGQGHESPGKRPGCLDKSR
jgi:hypothetical protein